MCIFFNKFAEKTKQNGGRKFFIKNGKHFFSKNGRIS